MAVYLQHFGLRHPPFGLTPDTDFYYPHAAHQEALNVLLLALRSGEGFVKVTGEVGTGKTLLCRKLLGLLETPEFATAYLPNPCLTPAGLRMALAEELGVSYRRNMGQQRLLAAINARLLELAAAGRRVVLILDEAQSLADEGLEALRLLTNLETEKRKLLQVVLFGQPELDTRLAGRRLRQLRQRVAFAHRLEALDRGAAAAYLRHRLQVAGHPTGALFTAPAAAALHRASRGIPRLLNLLAHKALMAAYGRGAPRAGWRQVRAAVRDTEDARAPWRARLASLFPGGLSP